MSTALNNTPIEKDSILPSNPALVRMALSSPSNEIVTLTQPIVAILTQGHLSWASSRFRGAWLQEAAPDLFRWYPPDQDPRLADYKVLVFQKRFSKLDVALARQAKDRGKKIVVDLTDPLWWFDPQGMMAMLQEADAVTVSSLGLSNAIRELKLNALVRFIPDRMKPSFHPTVAEHGPRDVVTLVWYGVASNRVGLSGAMPILAYVANTGHKFRLRIIDDEPTQQINVTGPFEVEHVPWTMETIHAQLTACDIALLPPYPGPWGEMKSNNREVTADWCGLPTADGFDAVRLAALIDDHEMRAKEGERNRRIAEENYDIQQSVEQWRKLLVDLGVTS